MSLTLVPPATPGAASRARKRKAVETIPARKDRDPMTPTGYKIAARIERFAIVNSCRSSRLGRRPRVWPPEPAPRASGSGPIAGQVSRDAPMSAPILRTEWSDCNATALIGFDARHATRGRIGGPERIRTSDKRFRKPLLYPTELRGHDEVGGVLITGRGAANIRRASVARQPSCRWIERTAACSANDRPAETRRRARRPHHAGEGRSERGEPGNCACLSPSH